MLRQYSMNETLKHLEQDTDGMMVYDYLVNHAEDTPDMETLIDLLASKDNTGQFLASSARFLHAVNSERFHSYIGKLVMHAIDKDRERRYIGSLLEALWGADYADRAYELSLEDDNFRRIYKRIFNTGF